MPDDLEPPGIKVGTSDGHQAIHLLRVEDAERHKAVVDLEAQNRVEQADAEVGVRHGRPITRRRQEDLQFDSLVERQMHEGVFGLGVAGELGLGGYLSRGENERAGDEPQLREERSAEAGSASRTLISHLWASPCPVRAPLGDHTACREPCPRASRYLLNGARSAYVFGPTELAPLP